MRRFLGVLLRMSLAFAAGAGCIFIDETLTPPISLVSEAHAVIGRPLTPLSYAGVARRTTRRAVAAGAAVGAAAAYAPGCYQAVDAYGRVYWRCP
jgi:hypothetical protein